GGETELVEEGLCAMMPGPDRYIVLVEHGRKVVRMDAVDMHREDGEAPLAGADEMDAGHGRQPVDAVAGERLLMLEDGVAAEAFEIVERDAEADGAGNVGRAGLEAMRRLLEGGLGEGHFHDHVAATLPGRHAVEQRLLAIEHADARRAIRLM